MEKAKRNQLIRDHIGEIKEALIEASWRAAMFAYEYGYRVFLSDDGTVSIREFPLENRYCPFEENEDEFLICEYGCRYDIGRISTHQKRALNKIEKFLSNLIYYR